MSSIVEEVKELSTTVFDATNDMMSGTRASVVMAADDFLEAAATNGYIGSNGAKGTIYAMPAGYLPDTTWWGVAQSFGWLDSKQGSLIPGSKPRGPLVVIEFDYSGVDGVKSLTHADGTPRLWGNESGGFIPMIALPNKTLDYFRESLRIRVVE